MIKEAVALELGQSCFELWQGHLGSPLAAEHPFQNRIVAMIQPPFDLRRPQASLSAGSVNAIGTKRR